MSIPPITKAIIPAAGLGTRFLPVTKASPKEMLPLVDKPLIQYVVEEAVSAGIRQIIIITGRGKRAIEDHFDSAFELEQTLREKGKREILRELERISQLAEFCFIRQRYAGGLGHAVLCAKRLIGNEPFAVLLGDDIVDAKVPAIQQLLETYYRMGSPVLGIQQVARQDVRQYGIIQTDVPSGPSQGLFRVVGMVEKPKPQDAPSDLAVIGRYLLTPDIFEILERTTPGKNNEIQLTDALRELAGQRPVYGRLIDGKRFDAGDKLGFLKATVEMGLKNPQLGESFRKYLRSLSL